MRQFLLTAATLAALVITASLTAPRAFAVARAAIVEFAFPTHPFFATLSDNGNNSGSRAAGPANGILGVTSIIATNLTPTSQTINIFEPIMGLSAADCGGGVAGIGGPGTIFMTIKLDPNQTLSLPFPSPLVLTPTNGHSCIAITSAPNAVEAYITGYVN